ncbi:cobaltochelatase subunit CobN [Bauldia sp.]|uniref:cobaltochelatase subunit CobN n=1 Tax=Bauldia sp. TaxID=2575872 RepID=UPI003BA8B5EA
MHLPIGTTERIDDGEAAVDLEQSPGTIVVLSAADTDLSILAAAARTARLSTGHLRLTNLMRLKHPLSVDLYIDRTLADAKLVVVRVLGGAGYWSYGLEHLRDLARGGGTRLVVIPGDTKWDPALAAYGTVAEEDAQRLWRCFVAGGPENAALALRIMNGLVDDTPVDEVEPVTIANAGCYERGVGAVQRGDALAARSDWPIVPIVFYRSILLAGSTAPIDTFVTALAKAEITGLPLFVTSLKDRESIAFLNRVFADIPPSVIINTTAFAATTQSRSGTVLDRPGCPVLQAILAGSSEEAWETSLSGLSPRDLAMNVVLPEVDGRLTTRAISFKAETYDPAIDSQTTTYRPRADRVAFVAEQVAAWIRVGQKPAPNRRVAIVLSNYPNRDGRIANGVGLDTPESAARVAAHLAASGYRIDGFPVDGRSLMDTLLAGPTNVIDGRLAHAPNRLELRDYLAALNALPASVRDGLTARWGRPEDDPLFHAGSFAIAAHRFGNLVVAVQPARGHNIDPRESYHDPDLVPPHNYFAVYVWLRQVFGADAMVHLGKHGNLEWLPGKALGLSAECWPEVALGTVPLIYPFIVNDPGEGAQAKRRSSAVIVDHLMPPMARAEIHGAMAELETMIDEYYLAAGVDPRRRTWLEREIMATAVRHGLDRDLGLNADFKDTALQSLDTHLCELKEMQIRDGLHILGASPEGRQRIETLVAIARAPRGGEGDRHASLHRAVAADLGLIDFDPLDVDFGSPWSGPCPEPLVRQSGALWRTAGDTVERIEALAFELLADRLSGEDPSIGPRSDAVCDWILNELAPAIDQSGEGELEAVLTALGGRFVPPGPSGAPSRGRPEVLPTGRNFYTVDTRAVPTPAAWALGRAAADALALRYFQDHGDWPRSIAMSAWSTSNMRTGGDDVAQVLALLGAEPQWDRGTGRVTGFRVMTLSELQRPRIDVTLKISGMFRDAFPEQIDLVDSAVRAVASLNEDDAANPIAAATRMDQTRLADAGVDPDEAQRIAGLRVFGAKPGTYGSGIQTLIDEGIWEGREDFAETFLIWGGYGYGGGIAGRQQREVFAERLKTADAVLHNQDNREHDLLDSDDYYQFQGGLAATVEVLRGEAPAIYHGDHARPEKPVIRSLKQEIARVVRGRAANPKWIAGVMRHGYKGAFEIAATVDYLFAYAAMTDAVGDHHFDQLYDAYIADDRVCAFIADANAPALREIAERFREAIDRGLWSPRSNSAYDRLSTLVATQAEAAE